jgi:cytochrome c oxidase subunit 3
MMLIMVLLLASLAMGLGALLVFYFTMRSRAEVWPPPGSPPLPRGLWLSTALLLASSGTMHAAWRGIRRGQLGTLRGMMIATTVLAIAFLVNQVVNWGVAVAAHLPPGLNMYAITFYLLTGLHGLHVLGGLVPLGLVTGRALARRYTAANCAGVGYCALYWHFVDGVWLVLFGALVIGQH